METWQLDSELQNAVTELKMALASLDELIPGTSSAIEQRPAIVDKVNTVLETIPALIQMVADTKPDPEVTGTKVKDMLDLTTQILKRMTVLKKLEPR